MASKQKHPWQRKMFAVIRPEVEVGDGDTDATPNEITRIGFAAEAACSVLDKAVEEATDALRRENAELRARIEAVLPKAFDESRGYKDAHKVAPSMFDRFTRTIMKALDA